MLQKLRWVFILGYLDFAGDFVVCLPFCGAIKINSCSPWLGLGAKVSLEVHFFSHKNGEQVRKSPGNCKEIQVGDI